MHRDERLNGARKAAALQTPRTIPLEYMLRKCQTKRNALLPRIFCTVCILVVFKRRMAACHDQFQKVFKAILTDGTA